MPNYSHFEPKITGNVADVAHIARPESVVLLAATVRAAREAQRRELLAGLKERVSEGDYAISSKALAQRVLASQ